MPAMIRVTRTEVGVLAQGSIVPRKLARRDALVQHATRQATRGSMPVLQGDAATALTVGRGSS